jgi:epoxide hydrolase-like predicted phosphatase
VIKAVIFDVGGVLLRTVDPSRRLGLDERFGLPPGECETLVFNSEMGARAQRGEISAEELWSWVQQQLDLTDHGLENFRYEFWAGDRLDAELINYIRRLRPRYQTAIISNAMDNLLDLIGRYFSLADTFDLIVGSAYEKVMKPSPAIFLRTLERLGRQPAEAVFIDDFLHNVEGARRIGMHAVHYRPGMDLPAALAELGVTPRE